MGVETLWMFFIFIMELTGKAKEDFEKWLKENYNQIMYGTNVDTAYFYDIILLGNTKKIESIKNTLIIEFFDSVGIYIDPKRSCLGAEFKHWYFVITDEIGCHLNNFMEVKIKNNSRQEAQTEAIKKANEIYNDKY